MPVSGESGPRLVITNRKASHTACAQQGIGVHGNHEALKDCLLTLYIVQAMAAGNAVHFEL